MLESDISRLNAREHVNLVREKKGEPALAER